MTVQLAIDVRTKGIDNWRLRLLDTHTHTHARTHARARVHTHIVCYVYITGVKRIRLSTLIIICLMIFALCFIRGLRNVANDGDVAVMSIKRFVHQHKKTLEQQFGAAHPHHSHRRGN